MTPENVVINISLNPETFIQLESLAGSPILSAAKKISLINIYDEVNEAKFLPSNIGADATADIVGQYIIEKLKDFKAKFQADKKMDIKVLFHGDVKLKAIDYLSECSADLVMVSTRGKSSELTKDSMSTWLIENAPCDVYVVRPVH